MLVFEDAIVNRKQIHRRQNAATQEIGGGDGFEIVLAQTRFNLVQRRIEDGVLPWCRERDIGVLSWGSLAEGLLTEEFDLGALEPEDFRRQRPNFQEPRYSRIRALTAELSTIGRDHGRKAQDVALAWMRSREGLTGVAHERPRAVSDALGAWYPVVGWAARIAVVAEYVAIGIWAALSVWWRGLLGRLLALAVFGPERSHRAVREDDRDDVLWVLHPGPFSGRVDDHFGEGSHVGHLLRSGLGSQRPGERGRNASVRASAARGCNRASALGTSRSRAFRAARGSFVRGRGVAMDP